MTKAETNYISIIILYVYTQARATVRTGEGEEVGRETVLVL